MKKALSGIITLAILILICEANLIEPITEFFVWLFTLSMTESNVSIAGEIFVKAATFIISYTAVGAIFSALDFFNSSVMKIAYFIISTLVSFALCYLVMLFETYFMWIAIGAACIIVGMIITGIALYIRNNRM